MKCDLRLKDGRIGEQPAVIYHVFHTLLFGGLALLFDGLVHDRAPCRLVKRLIGLRLWLTGFLLFSCRMKYLWTPYVCMFTAFGVCSPDLWMTVFKWLKLKSIHPVVLVGGRYSWRLYCHSNNIYLCIVWNEIKH